jgi:trimeric autotransporter adhesin
MKTVIPPVLITLALLCFALVQTTQAVSPPPDGGYPGGNTAEGQNALFSLTTGTSNTANGYEALKANTTGINNTAVGAQALVNNTGHDNTANGYQALFKNTTGNWNIAIGSDALHENTTRHGNTAIGFQALFNNTGASWNTANGFQALFKNTTGDLNTAIGGEALFSNTTGDRNAVLGFQALRQNTTGHFNTAIGEVALQQNTIGSSNSAFGKSALYGNTTGNFNTASGAQALQNNTTGHFNVALGAGAGSGVITADDVICIGRAVAGANVGGTCFIGNIRGVTTQNANALPVLIDGAGQLGTASSSKRFKHDIKPMGKASEGILALEPVTFHYKSDSANIPQFGLIAEEVEKVDPDLVVRDGNGEIYTVRYDQVNAMLLNEFLKEHRKVEQQQATITELKSTVAQQQKGFDSKLAKQEEQIEALAASLQKVSAQLELSKSAPQTVLNNQ